MIISLNLLPLTINFTLVEEWALACLWEVACLLSVLLLKPPALSMEQQLCRLS